MSYVDDEIVAVKKTVEMYLEFLRSEFDKLWEDAMLEAVKRSGWRMDDEVMVRKTSFIWLFIYDYSHGIAKNVKNVELAKTIFLHAANVIGVDNKSLFAVMQKQHTLIPSGVYQSIYKILDENYKHSKAKDPEVDQAFVLFQHKVYEYGYLNQVLTTKI